MTAREARDLSICRRHGTELLLSLVGVPHCQQCWREAARVNLEQLKQAYVTVPERRAER